MKLLNNLSIEQRMNTEWGYQFDPMQCAEILDGARLGLRAEAYANPDYEHAVMKEIKEGLLRRPSLEEYVDAFARRKNTEMSMRDIVLCVEKGVNVEVMLQLDCYPNIYRLIRMMMLDDEDEGYDFSSCENTDDVMHKLDEYIELADQETRSDSLVKRYIEDLRIMQARRR